jgi:hypothetical protein
MDWTKWVRERGTDCYCPIEDDGSVVIGMNLIGFPMREKGRVVGEFYYDKSGELVVELWPNSSVK